MLENDAFTYSDIFDDENDDNYAYTQTTVLAAADLAITKSSMGEVVTGYDATLRRFIEADVAGQVTAGKLLRYQVEVQNNGPSTSRYVTVQDTLPPTTQVTYLYADGADCWPDEVQNNVLYCGLGHMPAGTRKAFDIYVLVDSAVPNGTILTNTAVALSGASDTAPPGGPPLLLAQADTAPAQDNRQPLQTRTWDPNTTNNTAVASTTVNARADVWIEKHDVPAEAELDKAFEPDDAVAGLPHRYKITFGNDGPSVAKGVGVTDNLDYKQSGILGETFLRCEPVDPNDQVTCSVSGNLVTVTQFKKGNELIIPSTGNGTLNPGDAYSFYLVTTVDSGYVLDVNNTGTTPAPGVGGQNKGFLAVNTANISTSHVRTTTPSTTPTPS